MIRGARGAIVSALVLAVAWGATPVQAQDAGNEPGFTRIQGLSPDSLLLPAPALTGPLIDYREELRSFVQGIAQYARSLNPGFLVVARDAGELIIKRGVQDDRVIQPARTFMRSIDGIMMDGVFAGYRTFGTPPSEEIQAQMFRRIERAQRNGLAVMVQDYTSGRENIDTILRQGRERGLVINVSESLPGQTTGLPRYPLRPNGENPNNIISMRDVRNYLYLTDPGAFGRQDQFALTIRNTNHDLVIVEPFSGREPLSRQAVETLKYKKLGARRLVFAKMDIGTVSSYHYYWQPGWAEGTPGWIDAPFPGDPDRYFAEYWNPGWQQVIFGNPNSFVFGLVRQGYDGVLIEGLRNYLAFEGNVEVEQEFAPMGLPEAAAN